MELIDLHAALCTDGFQGEIQGQTLYNDYLHFSPEATPMLWKWLLGQVSRNWAQVE